ncbi:hypothetical protein [Ottowia sp.]|uniref:hypothetical protein n=1 Tax=Ottowia sp. TaxID=1898956 RepID=UPI003A87DBC1
MTLDPNSDTATPPPKESRLLKLKKAKLRARRNHSPYQDGDTVLLAGGDTVLLDQPTEPMSLSVKVASPAAQQQSTDKYRPSHPSHANNTGALLPRRIATTTPEWHRYAVAGVLMLFVLGWAVYATTRTPQPENSDAVAQASADAMALAGDEVLILPQLESISPIPEMAAAAASASAAVANAAAEPAATAAQPQTQPTRPTPKRAPPKRAPVPKPVAAPTVPAPAPTPAPPPQAPASQAVKRTPPARLCAGSSFIAHEVCLQNECTRAGMRQHPQCVRMRERQKLLRDGVGDG